MVNALLTLETNKPSNVRFFDTPLTEAQFIFGRQFGLEVRQVEELKHWLEMYIAGVLFVVNSNSLSERTPRSLPREWILDKALTGYKRTGQTLALKPEGAGVVVKIDREDNVFVYDKNGIHSIRESAYSFEEGEIS